MYPIVFTHSSVDGYLGCFHILMIINDAAVNTKVHIYLFKLVFWGGVDIYLEMGS